jgi:prevent-host-death family protein
VKRLQVTLPKEINAVKLRHNLGEILDAVANRSERFIVKRAGIPAAILLSIADYAQLEALSRTEEQDHGLSPR